MLHRLRPRYPQASLVGLTLGRLTLGLMLWAQPLTPQNASLEYKVKAAFLFNFAKFVEWPSGAFSRPDAPFTICLAGDPFAGELERTIDGNTRNGRPLAVFRIGEGEPVRDCHMIYISVPESRRSGDFIKAAANLPILTVGEHEEFINAGGMIRFTQTGGRIRFEINPEAAERASLKVSSRLLRLADIVHPKRAGVP